jgi:hypothetical protein
MKEKFKLFSTGVLQVFLVVTNTIIITKELVIPMLIVSYLISLIWSYNVTKVAFGTTSDRHIYSLGASFGAFLAWFLTNHIIALINYF